MGKTGIIIRLSHRQRWVIYSLDDIYNILYELIIMFNYIYNEYERRLISTLWCILDNIVYTDIYIDGYKIYNLWRSSVDPVDTIIKYSVNSSVYFQSNPAKKKHVINNIKFYALSSKNRSGGIIYSTNFSSNYTMSDYKKKHIEMFHEYNIIRKEDITLDGLI